MADHDPLPLNAAASIAMIRKVAQRLGSELLGQVVFLGGATLALLLTDPAVSEVRPTNDVDVIIEALSYGHYGAISEQLRQRGFAEDTSPGAPICRWTVDGVILDMMPTDEAILGFSNRWYEGAMRTAKSYQLPLMAPETEGLVIRLISPSYFLATKLEAFGSRGGNDIYVSHDLEDVVTLIDGCPELYDEVRTETPDDVKRFIAQSFRDLIRRPDCEEAVEGHLPADARNRLGIVMTRIRQIARLLKI
jgi:hypothetical protein